MASGLALPKTTTTPQDTESDSPDLKKYEKYDFHPFQRSGRTPRSPEKLSENSTPKQPNTKQRKNSKERKELIRRPTLKLTKDSNISPKKSPPPPLANVSINVRERAKELNRSTDSNNPVHDPKKPESDSKQINLELENTKLAEIIKKLEEENSQLMAMIDKMTDQLTSQSNLLSAQSQQITGLQYQIEVLQTHYSIPALNMETNANSSSTAPQTQEENPKMAKRRRSICDDDSSENIVPHNPKKALTDTHITPSTYRPPTPIAEPNNISANMAETQHQAPSTPLSSQHTQSAYTQPFPGSTYRPPTPIASTSANSLQPKTSTSAPTRDPTNVPPKIPPVVLRNKARWTILSKEFSLRGYQYTKAVSTSEGMRFFPSTIDSYRKITAFLQQNGEQFHFYQLPEERLLQVVIRGIPLEIDIKEVEAEIRQKFNPTLITRMKKGKDRTPMPLILVKLSPQEKEIYEIDNLCNIRVKVEALQRDGNVGQCYRCQKFGHVKSKCTALPKCLKCAEEHLSRDCTRPSKPFDPVCANCKGNHTANAPICPKNPNSKNAAPVNQQTRPVTKNISYSQVAATSTTTQPMLQSPPNIPTNGSESSAVVKEGSLNQTEVLSDLEMSDRSTIDRFEDHNQPGPSCSSKPPSEALKMTQRSISDIFGDISSFFGGEKSARVINAILYFISKDNLPLNTTDKEGFKHLLKTAAPLYKIPGRKAITNLIDKKYEVLSELIKNKLIQVNHMTLTTDIWTETMNTTSFLGLTVHFYFENKLNSISLSVLELSERHTGQYIGESLKSLCEEWNIQLDKVTAVVTDNGSNMVKAVSEVFGKNKSLPCFAHTLDLVASKIINETESVKNVISKVKNIVAHFKHSVLAADKMRKAQNVDTPLKLIQSVPTRWKSVFYMLERFLQLSGCLAPVLLENKNAPTMTDAMELEVLREIVHILKPIEEVSKEICGEKYLTSSKIIPIINCLIKNWINMYLLLK
ncbi:unnamed protein product [Brassicogethes aeneus]|uniref:CCHC-type domain-containing protein n=1 Tax=Brassicogethes aeneus TaxID=1431903 RepID=A0A9P0BGC6_BRAAE|nr:unnamed protein product [Brassicogethes aeneus]